MKQSIRAAFRATERKSSRLRKELLAAQQECACLNERLEAQELQKHASDTQLHIALQDATAKSGTLRREIRWLRRLCRNKEQDLQRLQQDVGDLHNSNLELGEKLRGVCRALENVLDELHMPGEQASPARQQVNAISQSYNDEYIAAAATSRRTCNRPSDVPTLGVFDFEKPTSDRHRFEEIHVAKDYGTKDLRTVVLMSMQRQANGLPESEDEFDELWRWFFHAESGPSGVSSWQPEVRNPSGLREEHVESCGSGL